MDTPQVGTLSFEDGYARLEQVIQKLEAGDLRLEEAVSLYEEGVKLARHCSQQLDNAELKVTQLLSGVADQLDEAPFEED